MPKNLPARCKYCGRTKADGYSISRRGLCTECGQVRLEASIRAARDGAAEAVRDAVAQRQDD